jgi:hypothetical protein
VPTITSARMEKRWHAALCPPCVLKTPSLLRSQ